MNVANSNAKMILKEHISKSTQAAVVGCELAYEIWAILKKKFAAGRSAAHHLSNLNLLLNTTQGQDSVRVYFDKLQDLILNLEASGFTRNNDVLYSVLALKGANKRFGPVCQVMLAGTEGADCDLNLIIVRARLELIETQDGEAPMEHGLVH